MYFRLLKYLILVWGKLFFRSEIKPVIRGPNRPRQTFETGPAYYMGDLLKPLDDYNAVIHELKKHDLDAYNYYVRVGCTIGNSDQLFEKDTLSARWRNGTKRPMAMMMHFKQYEKDIDEDKVYPTFLLIQKMRMVPGVQFTNADMYECITFYRERDSIKIITGIPFYMSVDPEGGMHLMLMKRRMEGKTYSKKLRRAKAGARGRRSELVDHEIQRWGIPTYLSEWAEDKKMTPSKLAQIIFTVTATAAETQDLGLLIRARKNNVCAAFAIDLLRTPYFFKDRIKAKTITGRTKPIFHIVRTHPRKNSKLVKTHFRGLRRFNWFGHDVQISMPGYHHGASHEFDSAAIHPDDPDRPADKKMMSPAQVGQALDDHMRGKEPDLEAI